MALQLTNVEKRIDAENKKAELKKRPRCPSCGKKIRGPGHDEGRHHKGGK